MGTQPNQKSLMTIPEREREGGGVFAGHQSSFSSLMSLCWEAKGTEKDSKFSYQLQYIILSSHFMLKFSLIVFPQVTSKCKNREGS